MNNTNHAVLIRALLFTMGKPMSKNDLSQKLDISKEAVEQAVQALRETHDGIVLIDDGQTVELRSAPEAGILIEKIRKEEQSKDIGRAGLETLAAILYRGPLSRSEIDFIRGVNSSYIVRTLLVRGLIRKIANPSDARSSKFEPTTELLAHLGILHVTELPEYDDVREKLIVLENSYRQEETEKEIV